MRVAGDKVLTLEQIIALHLLLGDLQTQRVGDLEMCFAYFVWSSKNVYRVSLWLADLLCSGGETQ